MPTPPAAPDRGHRPLGISGPDFGRRTPERLNVAICLATEGVSSFVARAGISPLMASEAASSILGVDNPAHLKIRRLVSPVFTPRQVALIKGQIAEFSHRRVSVTPPQSQTVEERSTTQRRGGS
jgi:hypothetical protein